MALTKSERAELKRLQDKSKSNGDDDTPRRRSTDKPKERTVAILRGQDADDFIASMFGDSDDGDDETGDEDADEDDEPEHESDERPKSGPRWFQ